MSVRKLVIAAAAAAALAGCGAASSPSGTASPAPARAGTVTLTRGMYYWGDTADFDAGTAPAGELPAGTRVTVTCQFPGTLPDGTTGDITHVTVVSSVAAQAGPMAAPGAAVLLMGQPGAAPAPACGN